MTVCTKCGVQINEDVKFCPACGADLLAQPENNQQPPKAAEQNNLGEKLSSLNNTADTTAEFDAADIESNKVMALLAYIIFFIPLLAAKDSPFARFHANQGLVLFLGAILTSVLAAIPVIGWILAPILSLVITVLAVIGIVNAVGGKAKELPIIGKFKILK